MTLLSRAEHPDPFRLLGPHVAGEGDAKRLVVRAFLPRASEVSVVLEGHPNPVPALRISPEGLFEAALPFGPVLPISPASYRWRVREAGEAVLESYDPYAFPPLLTDFDLHLMGEGTHYLKYEKMGAHLATVLGVAGVQFAVWAPNAMRVSVVGDFNQWDGRTHTMRNRGPSGVWELFVPGLVEGAIYKYEIRPLVSDLPMLKSDPYGFYSELRPKTGSIVARLDRHFWEDAEWMNKRANRDWLSSPISVYEVHLGSWRRVMEESCRWLSYTELADQLVPYVKQMGYTHVELMPVMEYPFDGSWGYQTLGYFAATSRYGAPQDFMYLVDKFHQAGIGVFLDWTPAHFPSDAHGLAQFDGTHLYEHADPRQGQHPDWGTLVFNYGRNEVQNFLISNALFWIDKYHIDGLRVDAVASVLYLDYSRREGEWIPNEFGGRENLAAIAFLKRLNEVVYASHPGVLTIAEESTAWPMVSRPTYLGGLGFSLKWNMGWMNDTLSYFAEDPVHRKYHHNRMTFSMLYAFTENFVLPFSHDEVVHGKASLLNKMPGDLWEQFANLRLLFGYMFAHPGKKLLFMGDEFGQRAEWDHETSLEWHLLEYATHRGLQTLMADLNALYSREAALHEVDFDWHGFEWLDCNDADASVLSFLRRAKQHEDFLVVVANYTPVMREDYRVAVPEQGFYREILNTDSERYDGSNVGNLGGVEAEPIPWGIHPYSLKLRLPPLGALYFKRERR
ncbi:MAG: 1,4-alpha-glucan branching protein GlgB [Acidobacteriia bacterium]|nr:1,4-alpha-glucan branching protein GlgB [Terriglobia bacterium]